LIYISISALCNASTSVMYTHIEEALNKDHKFPKQNGMFLTHFYIGYISIYNTHTGMIHAMFVASWIK